MKVQNLRVTLYFDWETEMAGNTNRCIIISFGSWFRESFLCLEIHTSRIYAKSQEHLLISWSLPCLETTRVWFYNFALESLAVIPLHWVRPRFDHTVKTVMLVHSKPLPELTAFRLLMWLISVCGTSLLAVVSATCTTHISGIQRFRDDSNIRSSI